MWARPIGQTDRSWAICKSAPCSREITMPAPHHSLLWCTSCCTTNSVKALKEVPVLLPFYSPLSRTIRVSRYQKKTFTNSHLSRSSTIAYNYASSIYHDPWHRRIARIFIRGGHDDGGTEGPMWGAEARSAKGVETGEGRRSPSQYGGLRSGAHTHTHTTVLRLCGNCPGQPGWAGTRRNIHPLHSS